jgi:hypothetical protein
MSSFGEIDVKWPVSAIVAGSRAELNPLSRAARSPRPAPHAFGALDLSPNEDRFGRAVRFDSHASLTADQASRTMCAVSLAGGKDMRERYIGTGSTRKNGLRQWVAYALCALVVLAGFPRPASAEIIGTEIVLGSQTRTANIERIERALATEAARERMEELGVPKERITERLAALTDAELATFADSLEQDPAGAPTRSS